LAIPDAAGAVALIFFFPLLGAYTKSIDNEVNATN
jgi:hypothetical protein